MNQLISLSSNLFLGMLHALEPGHGKTFFAAYMVGNRLRWRDLIMLVGGMLAAHFAFLVCLAFVVTFLIENSDFDIHLLTQFGPVVIIGFGIFLLIHELRHRHHEQNHAHADGQNCGCEAKHQKHKSRHPIIAGLLIGLLPCPSSLVPVMMGVGSNFQSIVGLIAIYVLGMGIVLTGFMFALNYFSEELNNFIEKNTGRLRPELISAVLVIVVGSIYLLFNTFGHTH